uniref:Mid2 domain-containing protein n=1 Tax=Moniliophthora roreri TaxID=221103 RepID=A0A0W0FNP6_MONRR
MAPTVAVTVAGACLVFRICTMIDEGCHLLLFRRVVDVNGSSVVSTNGPSDAGANIIPQMFLQYRATSLVMTLPPSSNASMNITVLTGNNDVLSLAVNSSVGTFAVLNLNEANTTTLSITFIQTSAGPSRLDIGNITITVSNSVSASVSIFPTQTLPPSLSLPPIIPPTPTISTASTSASATPTAGSSQQGESRKQLIAYAVGLTLGLGLGLSAVVSGAYILWKRRRRKQREAAAEYNTRNMDNLESAPPSDSYSRPQPQQQRHRRKDNMDTRWF